MKGKICFDFICDEALIFSSAASHLQQDGYTVCGLTLGNRWQEAYSDKFDTLALDLDESIAIDWDAELVRIAQQYKKYTPARFTQADRFICDLPRNQQKKILVSTFLKIEQLIESGVTIFLTTGVAYLYNLVILAVTDHYGHKAISLYGARQPEPRFSYSFGKGGFWAPVNEANIDLKKQREPDLEQEIEYVESFREKVKSPDYMNSARQSGGIKWVFIQEFLQRLKRWYLEGWSQPTDYLTQNPFWYAWRDVKRVFNKLFLNKVFSFDNKRDGDEFYIYPLHLQPEASTLILGDDYVDQLNTIKSIAKRLPADQLLYVKEHPAAYGRHGLRFYKEIQKIYNVKLIHHQENGRKLILDSKGVIVVSGTMGWEALLLGVPAIVLGSVFYDIFNGVYRVESLQQLESLLQSGVLQSPEIQDAAIAIKSVYSGSYPGYFDVHKLDTTDKVLDPGNLALINSGLRKLLALMQQNDPIRK